MREVGSEITVIEPVYRKDMAGTVNVDTVKRHAEIAAGYVGMVCTASR